MLLLDRVSLRLSNKELFSLFPVVNSRENVVAGFYRAKKKSFLLLQLLLRFIAGLFQLPLVFQQLLKTKKKEQSVSESVVCSFSQSHLLQKRVQCWACPHPQHQPQINKFKLPQSFSMGMVSSRRDQAVTLTVYLPRLLTLLSRRRLCMWQN